VDCDPQGSAAEWGAVPVHHWVIEEKQDAPAWIKKVKSLPGLVIIDGPPNLGFTVQSILLVSDLVLIPVGPSGVDIRSTGKLLSLIHEAQSNGKPEIWLIPSRIDTRTGPGRELPEALKGFNETITEPIRQRTVHVLAFSAGESINKFAPGSEAHQEIEVLSKKVKAWLKRQV
jgi:chromosome partitioning protein